MGSGAEWGVRKWEVGSGRVGSGSGGRNETQNPVRSQGYDRYSQQWHGGIFTCMYFVARSVSVVQDTIAFSA